jgi:hypothetical protein
MGIVLSSKFIEQLDIALYIVNDMPRRSCQPVVMSAGKALLSGDIRCMGEASAAEIEPRRKDT